MESLFAGLPIVAVLVLMIPLRWPATRAGLAGLAVALIVAVAIFGYGAGVPEGVGLPAAVAGALAEALTTAVSVLWIIFPALCIYHLQEATGAIHTLRRTIDRVSSDPRLVGLLVAWFFSLFLEGAAGFGTPIALAAPFLLSIGFPPVEAVTLALIGHAVGVTFGAVGAPVIPLIEAGGDAALALSQRIGLQNSLLAWVMALIVAALVTRAVRAVPRLRDRAGAGSMIPWAVLAAVLFLVPYYAVARWVGPELPSMIGGLVGGVVFVLVVRRWGPAAAPGRPPAVGVGAAHRLERAAAPYILLVALVVVTRLVPAVRLGLQAVTWRWTMPGGFASSIQVLYHPGTMLMVAFLLGALLQRAGGRRVGAVLRVTIRQLAPITLALVGMLGLSRVMVHAGMTATLALAAAGAVGGLWPLVAPLVGVLGTFITGSATASNILFGELQVATARDLGMPTLTLLAAQDMGAAMGNMICPHNIIAGGATVGLAGREGEVLRRTLWPGLLYALLAGALALGLIALGR